MSQGNGDANFTITATDQTKATFDAVEKRFGSLSNKAAESTSKLAGVASWAGYATGLEGAGKAAQALSGSLGILSGSMSLLGGPAGLALGAAAAIFAFATSSNKSAENISELDDQISAANKRVAELAGNMVEVQRIGLDSEIRKLREEMTKLKEETKGGPSMSLFSKYNTDKEYWKNVDAINANQKALSALTKEKEKYDAMARKGITDPEAEKKAAKEAEQLAKQQQQREEAAAKALATEKKSASDAYSALMMGYAEKENGAAAHYAKEMDIILRNEQLKVMTEEQATRARTDAQARYTAELEAQDAKRAEIAQKEIDRQNQQRDQVEAQFNSLQQSLMSQTQIEQQAYDNRIFIAEEWYQNNPAQYATYAQTMEQLNEQHQSKMMSIENSAAAANLKLWQSGWEGKRQVMSGVLGSMSTLMQSKNKTMFEVGKKAAISQAVIDTYASAVGAFKSLASIPYVGPVLGAAAAAAAVASGMAQVNAIRSTNFGGGSTGVSVGSGGVSVGTSFNGGSPAGAPQLPTTTQQSQQSAITIQILGDTYGLDDFRGRVVDAIRDATSRDVSFA